MRGWLDVWIVLSWLQEGYKPPCRLAGYFLAFGRAAIGAGFVVNVGKNCLFVMWREYAAGLLSVVFCVG